MKDELNLSYNDGGDKYLLQSVAIYFNYTVDMTLHKTAPVKIPGIRGPFHKYTLECGLKKEILTTSLQIGYAVIDSTSHR